MTLLDDLTKARDILVTQGHAKSAFRRDSDGAVCAMGAAVLAVGRTFEEYEPWLDSRVTRMVTALNSTLLGADLEETPFAELAKERRDRIYKFNDADETTAEDVRGLFDTTIARVRTKARK